MFSGASVPHLTPSGMVQGAQPSSSGASPILFPPMWWRPFLPIFAPQAVVEPCLSLSWEESGSTSGDLSALQANGNENETDSLEEDNDHVLLHDRDLGTLFAKFKPELEPIGTWDPRSKRDPSLRGTSTTA